MLGELNHALKNLAVLREKEIFRAQLFNSCVEGMIIEKDGAEDAALRFEIMGERAFDRGVCRSHSLYFRLGLFGMQEAEFLLRRRMRARSNYFLYEARGIVRVVRWRVNRTGAFKVCEYFGKVENVN